MKNINPLLIILIIIGGIFLFSKLGGVGETQSVINMYGYSSESDCQNRLNSYSGCKIGCVEINSNLINCLKNAGYSHWDDLIVNRYVGFGDNDPCNDLGSSSDEAQYACFVDYEEDTSGGTGGTCTETDGGLNYYVKGSIQQSWVTETDYCYSPTGLREYRCTPPYYLSYSFVNYECSLGCSNGECVVECPTGDTDCNGLISDSEVLTAINQWISNSYSDSTLLSVIGNWVSN